MAARSLPERPENRGVVALLEALDGAWLAGHGVVFAGGTRIALSLHEYRISRDADFLAVDRTGYATLRMALREKEGLRRLFRTRSVVDLPREPRMDQYGIRFLAVVAGERVKVEFVAEGRIELDAGESGPVGTVPWATEVDCFAEKLLANSDRWLDDAYLSRDVIDLAALHGHVGRVPDTAWRKAEGAYGRAVVSDLERAAERFLEREDHRRICFDRLGVTRESELIANLELLRGEARVRHAGAT